MSGYTLLDGAVNVLDDNVEEGFGTGDYIDEVTDQVLENQYDEIMGMDVRTLNHSIENPLARLYEIAVNPSNTETERRKALHFMSKTGYINRVSMCSNALLAMLKDDTLSLETRFDILTQAKDFPDSIEICLHGYVAWFYQYDEPILFKMLSAQYVLSHQVQSFPLIRSHTKNAQQYLYDIARKEKYPVKTRSEAADMLIRLGTANFRKSAEEIITALGNRYINGQERSFYLDEQNIHEVQYEKSLKELVKSIQSIEDISLDAIYEKIRAYSISHPRKVKHVRWAMADEGDSKEDSVDEPTEDSKEEKASEEDIRVASFQRIVMDTSTYCGYTMIDIIRYVYKKIQLSVHKEELEQRMMEELIDMHGWCSTGHVVRLLNILQGYEEQVVLTVEPTKELYAAVLARLKFSMRTLSRELQEEMILEFCSEEKSLLEEFVEQYSPYEELLKEYPDMDRAVFNETVEKAFNNYIGK
jgi:hypothetical protein